MSAKVDPTLPRRRRSRWTRGPHERWRMSLRWTSCPHSIALDLAPVVRSRLLDDLLELREMSRSHSGERGKCTHEDGYVPKDIQTALGLHHERPKCRECLLHVAEERRILGGLLVRSSSGYMRPIWSATGMKTGTCGTHTSLSMAAASSYSSRRV